MSTRNPAIPAGEPVFIGGINRSGTSMVRQILGSHSQLAIPPSEFEFFKRLKCPARKLLAPDDVTRLVDSVLGWPKVADWGLERETVLDAARAGGGSTRAVFVAVLSTYARCVGKPRFGDKTTSYERHLRTFDRWFDHRYAFVHMLRHPVSTYASSRWYEGRERRLDPRAWARQWNESVLIALKGLRTRRSTYALVRYEDVLKQPRTEVEGICAVAGLAFEDAMLSMVDFPEKENSSFDVGCAEYSGALRVRDAVDRAARVPDEELAVVRRECRRVAALVGYDVEDERTVDSFARPTSARELGFRISATARSAMYRGARAPEKLLRRTPS
jgi:hypothetical protein